MKLLITDLDNTLYDWVSYFARAFEAMLLELSLLLNVDEETLRSEFKAVHERYGNSEQPFAVFELSSVRAHFGRASSAELYNALRTPLDAFRIARDRYLKLYPSVFDTLHQLCNDGVRIVGHTEAIAELAYHRLDKLGIRPFLSHLYALDGKLNPHPDQVRGLELAKPRAGFITFVPRDERKPNPALLRDICARESISPTETWYVGDSLVRDVSMAKAAGVTSVWARYGIRYPADLWRVIVRITHWTAEDVKREARLRRRSQNVRPDYTIGSFSELVRLTEGQATVAASRMTQRESRSPQPDRR